jgi:hypothetical protein
LQVCIVNTRGISRAPFGKSVWHYKQLFDIRPINPYREKAFAVIDPVGDNTINFNNMMTKFGAGFFDERDSVLAELLNAFGRDDFRHGQKSAVIRSHNIIDFLKLRSMDVRMMQRLRMIRAFLSFERRLKTSSCGASCSFSKMR